ncbi:MAG: tRNA (cytidine(34)-2'-O)-methyltransferase [Methyloligellaceae bacterium]
MRLALYQPDIPQNTGTILRLAACLDVTVDIIGPTGFDMTDRALRRSGMDYLRHVEIVRHISFNEFLNTLDGSRLVLLSTHAEKSHVEFEFKKTDVLMLGRESSGAPEEVHNIAEERVAIPMKKNLRSLNIAIAAAMVLGEALRQTDGFS